MVKRALILTLLLATLGCTSDSSDFASSQIQSGMAQLVVGREKRLTYAALAAYVDVNGARMAELGPREPDLLLPIRSGPTTVSVSGSSEPGRYSIRFNAEAGRSYRLEVSPRLEGYLPPTESGVVVTENAGAFKLTPDEGGSPMQSLRRKLRL